MGNTTLSDDGILRLRTFTWDLVLDLDRLAEEAGIRVREQYFDPDKNKTITDSYINYPLTRAKKLCQLLVENVDDDEIIGRIGERFSKNAKLFKIWTDMVTKYHR